MNNTIIFWRNIPPDVNLGVFEYIANNWNGNVIVVSENGYPPERKNCGWNSCEKDSYKEYILSEMEDGEAFTLDLIENQKDAIHVFSGLRGRNEKLVQRLKKLCKSPTIIVIAERPAMYRSGIRKKVEYFLHTLLYKFLALKYRNCIRAFLAMGEIGAKQYIDYGFYSKSMFQYMYCPKQKEVSNGSKTGDKIRFLYIGRFDKKIKGIDVLMNAFDKVSDTDEWSLDLVGGYGDEADQVIQWCQGKSNVNYIGRWDYDDVCQNMTNYDVCIVPSKYDGWNLTPNQAIHTGIATIISDQAGSDELIKYSSAGCVIKSEDYIELKNRVEELIKDREKLSSWKNNAKEYKAFISPESVGQYFLNIIGYALGDIKEKPECPWRKV